MIYYFASVRNFDGEILYPKIPKYRMNNEDEKVKRICVSQSIDGCLVATHYNMGDIVFIHTCKSNNIISPNTKQVIDTPFTGEKWITKPVKMKVFIKLRIEEQIKRTLINTGLDINTYRYSLLH